MKIMKKKKLMPLTGLVLSACLLLTSCQGGSVPAADSGTPESAPASSESSGSGTDVGSNQYGQLIGAADPSQLPSVASSRKDTLVIGAEEFSGVFNPLYSESAYDWYVMVPTSGIASLQIVNDDGEMVDGTASCSVSSDGLTYTYQLKDDKFSDGTPVTSQDYVNCFKVLCDKSYDGPSNPPMSYGLVGAQDYHDGKASSISGITTPDDKTLVCKVEKPNASAQYMFGGAVPICTKLYGSLIKQGDVSGFKNLDMIHYVSNGPYILTEYKKGESATMTANPNYYGGEPKIKTVIVKTVASGSEMQAVMTGDVDLDADVTANADQVAIAQKAEFINLWVQPTLGYGYIGLNHSNDQFKDLKVRQALLYAIDRKSLVQSVYGEYGHVLNINQTAQSWLYTEDGINPYDYDPDKAAELLKEAGWEKDSGGRLMKDGKQFKIMFSASKDNPVLEVLMPMMIDAYKKLGIDFQAEYVDFPTLQDKVTKGNFEMYFMAWGLTADPDDSYIYSTGGSQNRLNYSNPALDGFYRDALASTDKNARKAAYQKVYQTINQDLPCYIVYQRSDMVAFNPRIKDFKSSSYVPFYQQIQKYSLQ